MFLTKKHLSRRTVLRGLGVSVALPLLDSMVPAQLQWRRLPRIPCLIWALSISRMEP